MFSRLSRWRLVHSSNSDVNRGMRRLKCFSCPLLRISIIWIMERWGASRDQISIVNVSHSHIHDATSTEPRWNCPSTRWVGSRSWSKEILSDAKVERFELDAPRARPWHADRGPEQKINLKKMKKEKKEKKDRNAKAPADSVPGRPWPSLQQRKGPSE